MKPLAIAGALRARLVRYFAFQALGTDWKTEILAASPPSSPWPTLSS